MSETVELKPCPGCEGDKAFSGATLDDQFYAMCGNDNCSWMVGYFASEAEARTAWNTRSDPAVRDRVTDEAEPLTFGYTNWRGECAQRTAIPLRIERKESEWHGPGLHWVMVAFDIEKQADRDFLLADMGTAALRTSPPEPVSGLEAAVRSFMPLAQVAFLWTKEAPPEQEVNRYRDAYQAVLRALPAPPAKEPQ